MQGNTTLRITIVATLALVGAATVFGGLRPQIASAAAFTVTKTADTNDGTCDSDCSLREAVVAANLAAGHDNISIPAGTYSLTGAGGEDASASGDLDVTDSVSFNGSGMTTTIIIGSGIDSGIQVFNGATTLILTDLTVQQSAGEGITADAANIDLANVAIIDNGEHGILTVSGNVDLQSSVIADNGNGGIQTGSGDVTLTRSTVSGNDGNGIETGTGDVTTTNSTISGNSSDGVETDDGDIDLRWSTVAENFGNNVRVSESGVIYLSGTIVADSIDANDCTTTVEDSDYSLDTDGSCGLSGEGDISDGDPDLGPLQDNGGTTETHALLGESQAIDAGGTGCPEDDQRNFNRYQGAACDIGAYESGGEQNTPGPTSTPGLATATATPGRAKTHTPTATGTPEATDTPVPATKTNTPAPAQPGGDRAGVVRGPDTGNGPRGGSSPAGLLLAAAMLVVGGAGALALGRRMRS